MALNQAYKSKQKAMIEETIKSLNYNIAPRYESKLSEEMYNAGFRKYKLRYRALHSSISNYLICYIIGLFGIAYSLMFFREEVVSNPFWLVIPVICLLVVIMPYLLVYREMRRDKQ